MKLSIIAILAVVLMLTAWQTYTLWKREGALTKQYGSLKAHVEAAQRDRQELGADLNYYANPANLEKELRARFNYRLKDEKMAIIVASAASSTATSTR